MKVFKLYLALLSMICAFSANAEKIYIIEGLFFHEVPMDHSLLTGLCVIQTENGTKATALSVSEPLCEEAKRFAVPKERIPEADLLLDLYAKERDNIIEFVFVKEDLLKTGDKFPRFSTKDMDGKSWDNSSAAGKVLVLNCWFTGCGPCKAEMAELSEWKNEMPDVMFFSSTYESPEVARPVLEKYGFNWIPLVDDRVFTNYIGGNGYPMTVVADKDGVIVQVEYGTSPMQRESLKRTIQSLR